PGEGLSLEALFSQTREQEMEAQDYLVNGEWETVWSETTTMEHRLPEGAAAGLWQQVFSEDLAFVDSPQPSSRGSNGGRVLTLDELAHLVQRPKPRRRPLPETQLALFGV